MTSADENGKLNWSVIGALVALAALGHQAISTVDENRKNGDAQLAELVESNKGRIETLEGARVQDAYVRGVSDQTLKQLQELADHNRERLEDAYRELDDKLQREIRQADDTIKAELEGIDKRFQGELGTLQAGKQAELLEIRQRINDLDTWRSETIKNRWTKEDQRFFEAQLGLVYRTLGQAQGVKP